MKGSIMFEVGDLVVCIDRDVYFVTDYLTVWKVAQVEGSLLELVRSDYSLTSGSFSVRAEHFALVTVVDKVEEEIKEVKEEVKVNRSLKGVELSINTIKNAGFSHIKVELEGNLGRNDDDIECDHCCGGGNEDCDMCAGEGFVDTGSRTRLSDETVFEECGDCYGEGYLECGDCSGSGYCGSYRSEDECESFMRDYVGPEINNRLTYGNFYEDGSVDSEFTFTLPIEHVADIIEWQKAFIALSDDLGGHLDVDGAGLHIALLPKESRGGYPICEDTLPADKVDNFSTQITKLMPALFFLASANAMSRNLGYRLPQVSSEKYSAISHHRYSCLEYRVFETCYDKPEKFYDYLETIANTLKFYTDPTLTVESLGKVFGFSLYGRNLSRFYETPDQLRILNSTIKHLKPKNKSYKKLKEERNMQLTIKELEKRRAKRVKELRKEYEVYKERQSARITPSEQESLIRSYMRDGHTLNEARRLSSNIVESFSEFLSRNLTPSHLHRITV